MKRGQEGRGREKKREGLGGGGREKRGSEKEKRGRGRRGERVVGAIHFTSFAIIVTPWI